MNDPRIAVIERIVQSAELDRDRSLARTFGGDPFPAFVSTADLRAALTGDAFISDSGSLVINRDGAA